MVKLFALEDSDEKDHLKNNELLIDKVLDYAKKDKSPMSLTADVLNQRQQLKKEINAKLNEPPEEGEGDNSNDNDSGENNDDSSNNDDNSDDNGTGGSDGENKPEDSDDKKTGNDSDAADNKDDLHSLVGSGLSDDKSDNKSDDKSKDDDKGDKTATESFKTRLTLSNLFTPLKRHYEHYSAALETFNLGTQKLAMEEQPIVYVKEPVTEALNNLVKLAANYISNNTTFVEKNGVAVKDVNEKISIFRQFVENEKFHFTNKLISDKDILSNVACPNKTDLTETARILLNYVEDATKANGLVVNNGFETITSSYRNQNFDVDAADLAYKTVLPGFNIVRVHLDPYRDYLKTDIQEFQYYKLKVLKTEDLYNLEAISITEDRDLNRLLDTLDKLIVNISLTTDNLKDINTHFTKFIDDIKVIIFDLEQDKLKNLASIDIDTKVKDFIKFKLVIESSYININMMLDFLVSVMTVLNQCVELND